MLCDPHPHAKASFTTTGLHILHFSGDVFAKLRELGGRSFGAALQIPVKANTPPGPVRFSGFTGVRDIGSQWFGAVRVSVEHVAPGCR